MVIGGFRMDRRYFLKSLPLIVPALVSAPGGNDNLAAKVFDCSNRDKTKLEGILKNDPKVSVKVNEEEVDTIPTKDRTVSIDTPQFYSGIYTVNNDKNYGMILLFELKDLEFMPCLWKGKFIDSKVDMEPELSQSYVYEFDEIKSGKKNGNIIINRYHEALKTIVDFYETHLPKDKKKPNARTILFQ